MYEWWTVILGLSALYIPTYYNLANGLWRERDQMQGPLMLILAVYAFWQQRKHFSPDSLNLTYPKTGGLAFGFGLVLYLVGRSQDLLSFEISSQIFVLSGLLLAMFGGQTFKAMKITLLFLIFIIPIPSFLVDAVTMPMKIAVSYVASDILFWFGYPIARAGVVLQVGPYQLLVADACAGLHTLISLEALGLLYLYVVKHDSLFRNVFLAILIIPISFIANVIRVTVLILVTYHMGDAAGQSFVHEFAGIVLFTVALTLIIGIDTLLQTLHRYRLLSGGNRNLQS